MSFWPELYHMISPEPDTGKGNRSVMTDLGESGFTRWGGGLAPPITTTKLGFSSRGKKHRMAVGQVTAISTPPIDPP